MAVLDSIDAPCGFVLTDDGRQLLSDNEHCCCEDLLVYDGLMRCRECGTVYGVVWGFNRSPRRAFRNGRRQR